MMMKVLYSTESNNLFESELHISYVCSALLFTFGCSFYANVQCCMI
jgi:hypothetical protein